MSQPSEYIELRQAVKNYLREAGVTLQDLIGLMDEEKGGILEALGKRVHLTEAEGRALESRLTGRELNYLLFVVQAFYILNPSGTYKGRLILPARSDIMVGDRVTYQGCEVILRALGIRAHGMYVQSPPRPGFEMGRLWEGD